MIAVHLAVKMRAIGHSNRTFGAFAALLAENRIGVPVAVRKNFPFLGIPRALLARWAI